MSVLSIYAKVGKKLYQVELDYLVNGKFVLRPITGKPYQYITASAEQIKKLFIFPIAGRQS